MDIDSARQLLNVKDETVSCFLVEPVDPARIDAVAEAIEQAIPGVDARTMSEFQAGAGQVLGTLDMLLLLIIGLSLIVGSVGILNTMLMSTTERFAEFGILRTNGWSRGDVLHLVLAESVCLGLLAGVAGAGLSAALTLMGVLDVVRAPLVAFASGETGGAALGVLASCPRRAAYPNATFTLSEPRLQFGGTVTAVTAREQQARRMVDSLFYRIADATGRPAEEIREDARRGRTLTTAEAIGYGLITERAGRAADASE